MPASERSLLTALGLAAYETEQVERARTAAYRKRERLFVKLRALDPPTSWARIAGAAGVSEQAVIQAVNAYNERENANERERRSPAGTGRRTRRTAATNPGKRSSKH